MPVKGGEGNDLAATISRRPLPYPSPDVKPSSTSVEGSVSASCHLPSQSLRDTTNLSPHEGVRFAAYNKNPNNNNNNNNNNNSTTNGRGTASGAAETHQD